MFARYVLPKFSARNTSREDSLTWIRGQREEFASVSKAASMRHVNEYLAQENARKKPAAE